MVSKEEQLMAWFEDGIDEVKESISKENFESWYEDIVGTPITLTRGQWHKVAYSLESAINLAMDETSQSIALNINDDVYFDGEELA
jgi:hypothetical protein